MGSHNIIGVDLGTTMSNVGIWENGEVKILGSVSSSVTFEEEWLEDSLGDDQINKTTIYDVKGLFGGDISKSNRARTTIPCHSEGDQVVYTRNGRVKRESAMKLAARTSRRLRNLVEEYTGNKAAKLRAVISVSPYFSDQQRQCTIDAGKRAGLDVLGILNDTSAAALSYAHEHLTRREAKHVLFCDFGGGTFHVSLIAIEDGSVVVKQTEGDTKLGGIDFDNCLVLRCANVFSDKRGKNLVDILESDCSLRKLRSAAEAAKVSISTKASHRIVIKSLQGMEFRTKITRNDFEALCADLFDRCRSIFLKCRMFHIHEVVLLGGSSNMPQVEPMLRECIALRPDIPITTSKNFEVARGVTLQAAILSGQQDEKVQKLKLTDHIPWLASLETNVGDQLFYRKSVPALGQQKVRIESGCQSMVIKVNHHASTFAAFEITGIPSCKRGAEICMYYDLDSNGIIHARGELRIPSDSSFKLPKLLSSQACRLAQSNVKCHTHPLICDKKGLVKDVKLKDDVKCQALKMCVANLIEILEDEHVRSIFEVREMESVENALQRRGQWSCKDVRELFNLLSRMRLRSYAIRTKNLVATLNIVDADKAQLVAALDNEISWTHLQPTSDAATAINHRIYVEELQSSILGKNSLALCLTQLRSKVDNVGGYDDLLPHIEAAELMIQTGGTLPTESYEIVLNQIQNRFYVLEYVNQILLSVPQLCMPADKEKVATACAEALHRVRAHDPILGQELMRDLQANFNHIFARNAVLWYAIENIRYCHAVSHLQPDMNVVDAIRSASFNAIEWLYTSGREATVYQFMDKLGEVEADCESHMTTLFLFVSHLDFGV